MLEKLYKGLFDDGNISIPFEQFQNKFENDSNYRQRLHTGIVEDGDFSGDYNTFENKFLGKTNGSADATPTGGPNVMGSQSDDGSFELPQITKEETKLVEELGIRELQKKLSGLGFTFKESSLIFGDTKVFGYDISDLMPGSDYIIITSPPDADGNTVSEKFSFEAPDLKYRGDKKGIGYRG